jgi:hypothetical protein
MDIKEWVKKKVRPHLTKECDGLVFPDDCIDTIENDLEGLVKAVKDNTLKSLVAFIRSQAPELEHGDERWGVAKDVEDGSFEKWEKEANAFLKEAVGEPPKTAPDYSWIKVKRFTDNPALSWEERFRALEAHHEQETKFLIAEVERLRRPDAVPAVACVHEPNDSGMCVKCGTWTARGRSEATQAAPASSGNKDST